MKRSISRRSFLKAAGMLGAAGVLAACGGSSTASSTSAAASSGAASGSAASADLPSFKIGIIYSSFTDVLGYGFKRADTTAGNALNCELVFVEATGEEAFITGAENLIQSGCDGIVASQIYGAMIEACDKAGVYLMYSGNTITDPDLKKLAVANAHYVGSIMEDNYAAAYAACQALYDAGSRNWAYTSIPIGVVAHYDLRTKAVENFAAEHSDVTIKANYLTSDITTLADGTTQMLAAYPELDGFFDAFGSASVLASIYSANKNENIKYACMNTHEGCESGMEDGTVVFFCSGQYPTQATSLCMLYNALCGYPDLFPDKGEALLRPFIYVTNLDEAAVFNKYFAEEIPDPGYTAAQYLTLGTCHDFAVFEQYAKDYSIAELEKLRG